MSIVSPVRFFQGANTPSGFFGFHQTDLYDPRDGWVAFLIKSGAGTGKATFMRRVCERLESKGLESELFYCSSDPNSLDAIRFEGIKLCVVDATAPHVIEPYAYGECEQLVPFGCCLQVSRALPQATDWFRTADACAASHARCCRFLAAAHSLLETNRRLADTAVLTDKLQHTALRLIARECGKERDHHGKESRRFLSAITPEGHLFFKDTATALCPKLYVLNDEYGAVSSRFMPLVRQRALHAGLDVIGCYSPLSPQGVPEHVLIPALGVGFVTSNNFHAVDIPVYRRIHAARFLQSESLREHKQQLTFNRRAAIEMLREAVNACADAKSHHDCMESLHAKAMDWDTWERIADRTTETILRIAEERMG